ncbi:MAG: adenylate/guanylate cyclase domain-containing protein [Thermodesulfobacteriota bacterium]|nr:adenylate/guanylate cyclase domain-containing protein [Thermodesulfobacteriota bacterium]
MQNGQLKKHRRLPLFFRVSIAVFLLFCLSGSITLSVITAQQQRILFAENLKSAELILGYFASSAKIPLLVDDTLRLNGVVQDAGGMDGIVYAFILDRDRNIQAYSDGVASGTKFIPPAKGTRISENKDVVIVQYADSTGLRILDLSRPVLYHGKSLGSVHLGLSLQAVQGSVTQARDSLLRALFVPGICILVVLICLVVLFTLRRRKRLSGLIHAAREYGKGNLSHEIKNIENNELGDLAQALNRMAEKLSVSQVHTRMQLEQLLKRSSLDRILESPLSGSSAHAVRRQVVILFAGVKGFGSYATTEKPEEVVLSLNKYISVVTNVISEHGGYVDKIIGDAVVGIFGVSLYRENHTDRAIQAAMDIQESLSLGSKEESQLLSNVCIGISSGIVLSGNIGSHSKVEYSSIGESIKEAYCLIGLGQPGDIILGEGVFSQMKDLVEVEPLPVQKSIATGEAIKSYRFLQLTKKEK